RRMESSAFQRAAIPAPGTRSAAVFSTVSPQTWVVPFRLSTKESKWPQYSLIRTRLRMLSRVLPVKGHFNLKCLGVTEHLRDRPINAKSFRYCYLLSAFLSLKFL